MKTNTKENIILTFGALNGVVLWNILGFNYDSNTVVLGMILFGIPNLFLMRGLLSRFAK